VGDGVVDENPRLIRAVSIDMSGSYAKAIRDKAMFRAFLLKEELRLPYALQDPALAPAHVDAWLAWASRSRLEPFVRLARTIRRHRDGILAAIRLGLSNVGSKASTAATAASAFTQPHPHRPRLPLLQPNRHRPTQVTFTPSNLTGAPDSASSGVACQGSLSHRRVRHR
jgi:hypothetical protein